MQADIKTYLGKRGYVLIKKYFPNELINNIKKELTVKPYINDNYGDPPEEFEVFTQNANKLYIPKYYGINKLGPPDANRLPDGQKINLKFKGKLRPNQIEPVNVSLKALKEDGGGILSLPCASGKTVISLFILSQLGGKTLIIVHKEFLMYQWKERIEQFLTGA